MRLIVLILAVSLAQPVAVTRAQSHSGARYRETVLAIQDRIQAGDLAGARSFLDSAARRFPRDGGIENLRGVILIEGGDVAGARQAFQEAITEDPRLVSAYLNLARLDLQSGPAGLHVDEAIHLYSKVLAVDPANTEASVQAARWFISHGEYARSLALVSKPQIESVHNVQVLTVLCAGHAALGHAQAAQQAAAALSTNPDLQEADAFFMLPALRFAHRADLIDQLFASVQSRTQLSAAGLRVLGLAQEAESRRSEATATLERAFAADPRSSASLIDLTRIAISEGKYQEALGYLAHARELSPKDSSLAYEFGVICFKMNLLGEAQKAMGEALALSPEHPEYLLGMGTISSLSDDPLRGVTYLCRYHSLRPADPNGALRLGAAYFRAKDFDAARPWLLEAANLRETAAEANLYLASILRQSGDLSGALEHLKLASSLRPDDPDTLAETGTVYLRLRRYPDAYQALQKAVGLDPDSYAANFALLQLFAQTRDPRQEQQAARFEAIKSKSEQQYKETMRVLDIRSDTALLQPR